MVWSPRAVRSGWLGEMYSEQHEQRQTEYVCLGGHGGGALDTENAPQPECHLPQPASTTPSSVANFECWPRAGQRKYVSCLSPVRLTCGESDAEVHDKEDWWSTIAVESYRGVLSAPPLNCQTVYSLYCLLPTASGYQTFFNLHQLNQSTSSSFLLEITLYSPAMHSSRSRFCREHD